MVTDLRRRIFIVALMVLAFVACLGAFATSSHAATQSEINSKLKSARAKIADANDRKKTLSNQIAAIDKRLTQIDAELHRLDTQIASVEGKLSTTREKLEALREQLRLKRLELVQAEKDLQSEEDNLAMRAVAAYKTSDLTYMDVVLASTSFEDLVSRTRMVGDLINGTNDLVGQLEQARDRVQREKKEIATKEQDVHSTVVDLQQQSDDLAALEAAQTQQKADSKAARLEKKGALSAVEDDIAVLKKQEAELLAESQQLSGVINNSSGGGGTGDMMRPVNGPITSPFGWRIHPIFGYRKFHTGVDFGVGYGTPIHAADSGTVIYATWMGGYGNVIIVNHGGGISTLYAHQSSFAVSNGASVTRGQVIGYVGSTGYSTGPHLHFEVRVNGNPVDPMGYIN